jgi:hypothetical protein
MARSSWPRKSPIGAWPQIAFRKITPGEVLARGMSTQIGNGNRSSIAPTSRMAKSRIGPYSFDSPNRSLPRRRNLGEPARSMHGGPPRMTRSPRSGGCLTAGS